MTASAASAARPLGRRRAGACAAAARRRAPARLGALRRPRRLHDALGAARPGGGARAPLALLRDLQPADRPLRRHGREVHRRRGDGGLGHADRDGGRRRARGARGARPRGGGLGARRRGRRARAARARRRADRRGGGDDRRRGRRAWSPATSSTRPRGSSRPPSPGTVLVGDATRRATEQTVVYEDAGTHALKGKDEPVAAVARAPRRLGRARRSSKSTGLEAPFVGRDRELRRVKDLFHECADERQGAPRLGHRHRRHRQVAARVGVLQVLRRHRADDVLAPRPLPLVRRGRDVLGARRHGADALPDRRGGRAGGRAREARARRSRSTCPTRTSARSSSRGSRTCSDSPSTRRATSRTCSRPGGCSSSASRTSTRRCSRSRTCSGPTRACSTSSSTCSSGRATRRSSSSRSPGRSSPTSGRRGARVSATSRRSTSSRCRARRWSSCSPGSCRGCPSRRASRSSRARRASRCTRSRRCACCSTAACSCRTAPSTCRSGEIGELEVPETLHALIAARLDGLSAEERRLLADGAVLGKTFTRDGLQALSGLGADAIEPLLASLVRKEVLARAGGPPLARARPVRLPAGPRAPRRLRDALAARAPRAPPRRRRVPAHVVPGRGRDRGGRRGALRRRVRGEPRGAGRSRGSPAGARGARARRRPRRVARRGE